jgi:hypothetical protein
MIELWNNISLPQATLLLGVFTLLAAIFGVLIGAFLFSGKVSDIKSAIDTTEGHINEHLRNLKDTTDSLSQKSADLDSLMGDLFQRFNKFEADEAAEDQGSDEAIEDETEVANEGDLSAGMASSVHLNLFDEIEALWEEVRNRIELIAAHKAIDGRTRGKYRRVDRRSYQNLIDLMEGDKNLPSASEAKSAYQIRMRFRNRRKTPDSQDIEQLNAAKRNFLEATMHWVDSQSDAAASRE